MISDQFAGWYDVLLELTAIMSSHLGFVINNLGGGNRNGSFG